MKKTKLCTVAALLAVILFSLSVFSACGEDVIEKPADFKGEYKVASHQYVITRKDAVRLSEPMDLYESVTVNQVNGKDGEKNVSIEFFYNDQMIEILEYPEGHSKTIIYSFDPETLTGTFVDGDLRTTSAISISTEDGKVYITLSSVQHYDTLHINDNYYFDCTVDERIVLEKV